MTDAVASWGCPIPSVTCSYKIEMDCDGEYTKYSAGVPCTVGPVCLWETKVVGCRDVVT